MTRYPGELEWFLLRQGLKEQAAAFLPATSEERELAMWVVVGVGAPGILAVLVWIFRQLGRKKSRLPALSERARLGVGLYLIALHLVILRVLVEPTRIEESFEVWPLTLLTVLPSLLFAAERIVLRRVGSDGKAAESPRLAAWLPRAWVVATSLSGLLHLWVTLWIAALVLFVALTADSPGWGPAR